jgi:arsenical pump membrane protein
MGELPVECPHDTERPAPARWPWPLLAAGVLGAGLALRLDPGAARQAAAQTWSPFVLVTGLLLVGLVAEEDGLFRAAGRRLARRARRSIPFFASAALLVAIVTATLNLDTAVVFVTPVLIAAARSRGGGAAPLLYGSLLLANASSLFLPGSNLTNLIVVGQAAPSGRAFLAQTWPAATAACVVTAVAVGVWGRHELRSAAPREAAVEPATVSVGAVAVVLSVLLVLVLPDAALPVLGVGLLAMTARLLQGRVDRPGLAGVIDLRVLGGLFAVAVAAGTLGRVWTAPATVLSHAGPVGTAAVAAGASVLLNNLPAAALLAPGHAGHPAPLLIGLNLGPNFFVTGSLAWFLWLRVARASGARPSVRQASRLGLVIVPLTMAAALGAWWLC